jgi:hypothetical protein
MNEMTGETDSEIKTSAPRDVSVEGDEARASSLDLTDEALQNLAARAVELVTGYFQSVAEFPV